MHRDSKILSFKWAKEMLVGISPMKNDLWSKNLDQSHKIVFLDGWMVGWMDGWMDGWVGASKIWFKDCLQQFKKMIILQPFFGCIPTILKVYINLHKLIILWKFNHRKLFKIICHLQNVCQIKFPTSYIQHWKIIFDWAILKTAFDFVHLIDCHFF